MADQALDARFLRFLEQHRRQLLGSAYLLYGDANVAERLVSHAVAVAYAQRQHFLVFATEQVLNPDPRALSAPRAAGQRTARVELVDRTAEPIPGSSDAVIARLQQLSWRSRGVLVLRRHLGLSAAGTVELLQLSTDEVDSELSRTLLELGDLGAPGAGGPVSAMDRAVTRGLAGRPPATAADDLARGQQLLRRRRLRLSGLVAAAVAAVVFVGALVWPDRVTVVEVSAPAATRTPTPTAAPACTDPRVPECRVQITRDWRYRISGVVEEKLDPKADYFSGYSYGYDENYDSDSLWQGRGGALALDLFSERKGSTVVFVQIATTRDQAIRCGALTKNRCVRQQMMDFNFFTMTTTDDARRGVEVQYCPDGKQTITIVARDLTQGRRLRVTRGDLLQLIQDPRLKLPKV